MYVRKHVWWPLNCLRSGATKKRHCCVRRQLTVALLHVVFTMYVRYATVSYRCNTHHFLRYDLLTPQKYRCFHYRPRPKLLACPLVWRRPNYWITASVHHFKELLYSLDLNCRVMIDSAGCILVVWNRPRPHGGAHGGMAPAKIGKAPGKITGLFMLKNWKRPNGNPVMEAGADGWVTLTLIPAVTRLTAYRRCTSGPRLQLVL